MIEPDRQTKKSIEQVTRQLSIPLMGHQFAMTSPIKAIAPMLDSQRFFRQLSAPLMGHQFAMTGATKAIASMLDSQRLFEQSIVKQIENALAPSVQLQEQIVAMASQVAVARDNSLVRAVQVLSKQLHEYEPSIETAEDGFVIDREAYTQSAIEQAFISDEILAKPSSWTSLRML